MEVCGFTTSATSRRGDLPDRNINDIFCPMFGGPDYKHNYLASSCRERQLSKTCTVKSCARRVNLVRPKLVQVSAATERQLLTTEEIAVGKKPVRACAECERIMTISGRGLCGGCLKRLQKEGTLDDKHPAKRPWGKAANAEDTKGSDLVDDAATAVVDRDSDPADDVINAGQVTPKETSKKKTTEDSKNSRPTDPVFAEEKPDMNTRTPRRCESADNACHKGETGTSPDPDVTAGETAQKHVTRDGVFVVRLEFIERDSELLKHVELWADKERRSLSDQILFAIDNLIAEKVQRGEL